MNYANDQGVDHWAIVTDFNSDFRESIADRLRLKWPNNFVVSAGGSFGVRRFLFDEDRNQLGHGARRNPVSHLS